MALVNIGEGNRDDGFYRYKMPRLLTKIEGRGNGIKTNLVNMVDVAKALSRPPTYLTKYFGCVLGAQSKYEEKSATSTVNGAHETAKLVDLLEGFIKKYVQCYGCGNPETEIVITKKQMITLKCAACGFVSDVDMRDKLTTFILNNPPEKKKAKSSQMRRAEKERLKAGESLDVSSKTSKKSGVKQAGKKTKKKEAGDDSPDSSQNGAEEEDEEEDNDVVWQTDTSAEAAKLRIQEQLTAATSEMVMLDLVEEEKKKKKAKASSKKSSVEEQEKEEHVEEEEEEEEASVQDVLVEDLKDFFRTHNLAETASYVQSKGELTQGLIIALFHALFEGVGKGLAKEVGKKKALLESLVDSESKQLLLLVAVEEYCGVHNSSGALKETARVLKELYDKDIVEEEQFLAWNDRKDAFEEYGISLDVLQATRKEAAPFIAWLREAEAESDEE